MFLLDRKHGCRKELSWAPECFGELRESVSLSQRIFKSINPFPFPGSSGYDLFTSALLGLLFSIYSKSTDDSKYHCSVKDRLTLFFQGSFSHDHEFLASFDCHSLLVPECHHLKH